MNNAAIKTETNNTEIVLGYGLTSGTKAEIAKDIASTLRDCKFAPYGSAKARGGRVFVRTDHPASWVGELTPPGWGARQSTDKYDVIIIEWVG